MLFAVFFMLASSVVIFFIISQAGLFCNYIFLFFGDGGFSLLERGRSECPILPDAGEKPPSRGTGAASPAGDSFLSCQKGIEKGA